MGSVDDDMSRQNTGGRCGRPFHPSWGKPDTFLGDHDAILKSLFALLFLCFLEYVCYVSFRQNVINADLIKAKWFPFCSMRGWCNWEFAPFYCRRGFGSLYTYLFSCCGHMPWQKQCCILTKQLSVQYCFWIWTSLCLLPLNRTLDRNNLLLLAT